MSTNKNLLTDDWTAWRNNFKKQNVENYIRLRNDFDFQKEIFDFIKQEEENR